MIFIEKKVGVRAWEIETHVSVPQISPDRADGNLNPNLPLHTGGNVIPIYLHIQCHDRGDAKLSSNLPDSEGGRETQLQFTGVRWGTQNSVPIYRVPPPP